MSDYIVVDGELCHYGVKGMKWGVRREIGKKAKTAAHLERMNKTLEKQNRELERRMVLNAAKGKHHKNIKVSDARNANKWDIERNEKLRKTLVSDLSEKDIKQGRRALMKMGIIGAFVGGVPGALVTTAGNTALNQRRANNYLVEASRAEVAAEEEKRRKRR